MGRPTALNSEVQDRIVRAVSEGVTLKEAAAYARITDRTLLNWMRRGEQAAEDLEADCLAADDPDREFVQFFLAVSAARAEVYLSAVATVRLAIRGSPVLNQTGDIIGWERFPDWRAAAWFLEHGDPTQWGRASRTVPDQAAEETSSRDEERVALDEELDALVEELVARRKRRMESAPEIS